jgi:predicted molibdopterin-dependent oxidoreductase YjgC
MNVRFHLDGESVSCPQGLSLGAAIMHLGQGSLPTSPRRGRPGAVFCGMGLCHDCAVEVNGRSGVRACCTPVVDGMNVETRAEPGKLPGSAT